MAKILFAGDFCPFGRMPDLLENGRYDVLFGEVKEVINESDYSIVNFETTLADPSKDKPIKKCGPALCTSSRAVEALKYAGFRCCSLANNHFNDYGQVGIEKTLAALDKNGLDNVGAGSNLNDAGKVLYKDIAGKNVAIISCCEHEFSIATDDKAGCNPLDPVALFYTITEAKKRSDFVFLIVHGGLEHIQVPQPRMKRLYRYFVDLGADAVINHHQHCYNGMEVYKGKPIFYGLGNFCFDWDGKRNSIWNEGYMVRIELNDTLSYEVIPYTQCNEEPTVKLLKGDDLKRFQDSFKKLSDIIQDDALLQKMNTDFFATKTVQYRWIFEPYAGRVMAGLYFRKLLPSFADKNKETKIDFIECESHREALLDYLKR